MKNRIKLVVSDIDGTLLNERHRLSRETIGVVTDFVSRGGRFAIATGRNHHDAEQVRRRIDVPAYLISANGATIASPDGQLIHRISIPEGTARSILEIDVPPGIYRNIYQGTEWFMEEPEVIFTEYYVEGDLRSQIVDFDDILHRSTDKIFFTSRDHRALAALKERIERQFGDQVALAFSMNQCLEVIAGSVNKGVAVRRIAEMLEIQMDEIVAFGDGMNDYEMLGAVGTGYIMENGHAQLKTLLPHLEVIRPHSDHGVARKIAELFDLSFPGG